MSTVEKFSISLTHEMAKEVQSAVQKGEYASSSEVIRDALRVWHKKREYEELEIQKLRYLWDEGITSGLAENASAQDIIKEAKSRLSKKGH